MVASMMASQPANHVLMGGPEAAITWLSRFISHLPLSADITNPLITSPVLDAFLTAAEHMLANVYADQFKILLEKLAAIIR